MPPRKPGLASLSPEQLKALRDRQAQGTTPDVNVESAFKSMTNPNPGAALSFMQGTPMPAGTALKKGGMVKKASKGSSASKRADGCTTKGKTKGRMV